MKFTDTWLASLRAADKRQEFYEPNGFGVIVFPGGDKTFYYRYMIHGRPRRLKLGSYPAVTLAKARKLHADVIERVQNAREHQVPDPVIERKQRISKAMGAPTVSELAERAVELLEEARGYADGSGYAFPSESRTSGDGWAGPARAAQTAVGLGEEADPGEDRRAEMAVHCLRIPPQGSGPPSFKTSGTARVPGRRRVRSR